MQFNILFILIVLIVLIVLILLFDSIYLSISGSMYKNLVQKVQNAPLTIHPIPAIIVYIGMSLGLYYFIIRENKKPLDAFFLGLLIYGTYGFTNLATINKWDYQTVLIDTLWGGILLALVTYSAQKISTHSYLHNYLHK